MLSSVISLFPQFTGVGSAVTSVTTNGSGRDFPEFLNWKSAIITINITGIPAGTSPTITFSLDEKDPMSAVHTSIVTTSALNGTGTTRILIGEGSGQVAGAQLFGILRLSWTLGGTISSGQWTFTASAVVRTEESISAV